MSCQCLQFKQLKYNQGKYRKAYLRDLIIKAFGQFVWKSVSKVYLLTVKPVNSEHAI